MDDKLTFREWCAHRVKRFVELSLATPDEHRADYMQVQAKSLVDDALHFSRSGLQDDDPMPT
jgi:hypothetical protein